MLEFVFVPDTDIEGYELAHAGHFGMFPSENPGIHRATGTFNDTGSFELAVDFYPPHHSSGGSSASLMIKMTPSSSVQAKYANQFLR
jgi:hypothetical protein